MIGPVEPDGSNSRKDPIDLDDPLYAHPSDNTITSVINFKLIGTENLRVWRNSMIRALKARSKLRFTDGNIPKPTNDPVKDSKWEHANAITCSWILGSISENIYENHACFENAQDICKDLFESYHKTDGSIIFNVHHKISSLTQGNLSLSKYFNKLEYL